MDTTDLMLLAPVLKSKSVTIGNSVQHLNLSNRVLTGQEYIDLKIVFIYLGSRKAYVGLWDSSLLIK